MAEGADRPKYRDPETGDQVEFPEQIAIALRNHVPALQGLFHRAIVAYVEVPTARKESFRELRLRLEGDGVDVSVTTEEGLRTLFESGQMRPSFFLEMLELHFRDLSFRAMQDAIDDVHAREYEAGVFTQPEYVLLLQKHRKRSYLRGFLADVEKRAPFSGAYIEDFQQRYESWKFELRQFLGRALDALRFDPTFGVLGAQWGPEYFQTVEKVLEAAYEDAGQADEDQQPSWQQNVGEFTPPSSEWNASEFDIRPDLRPPESWDEDAA